MQDLGFIALDVETTGIDESAEIIEIGLVKVWKGEVVEKFESLIKPLKPIPEEIIMLTGITNEMVYAKPGWVEIEKEILTFIGDSLVVAHNAPFDRGFLERALGFPLDNTWIDTCELAKVVLPTAANYKLMYLSQILKLPTNIYHRALYDAETCAHLFLSLVKLLQDFSPFTLDKILSLLAEEKQGINAILQLIQKHLIANFNFDRALNEKTTKREYPLSNTLSLSFTEGTNIFKPDGLLSLNTKNYQYRPQQVNMSKTVSRALENGKHAILEAGTGTGKSLAYLIPSLLWSAENKCRIVIATNTIALQEQLYKKDIPFLEKCLNYKFSVSLNKGRSNYLCLRRLEMLKSTNKLSWTEKIFLAQIISWLENTLMGDKEELNLNNFDNQLWSQISSQTETCVGNKCSFHANCFYLENRRQGEKSNIIITNHALLLQDLKNDNKILPKYDYVIIDEAHNLEDEVTKQFATIIDLDQIRKVFNRLSKSKGGGILNKFKILVEQRKEFLENEQNLLEVIDTTLKDITSLDDNILQIKEQVYSQKEIVIIGEKRISATERKTTWWRDLEKLLKELELGLTYFYKRLVNITNKIEMLESFDEILKEINFLENEVLKFKIDLNDFLEEKKPEFVYWLEITNSYKYKNLILTMAPINVNELLSEYLFKSKKSVVLTSATLAVNTKLDYIGQNYGLKDDDYLTFIADSPFNYQQQSILCIPKDLPDPNKSTEEEYTFKVAESIQKIIPVVKGGILILFTSYRMLNSVYYHFKKDKSLFNRDILAHGKDGNRSSLIEALKNKTNCVVLGTNSFWEGIDISGINLTTVIIVKLPFYPPFRPVIQAKMEKLEKEGHNSFYKYSLPQAILRFRQGYGRLIRSNEDWGTVIVLDNRILTKRYGQQFIKSLPPQPIIRDSVVNICQYLNDWMKQKE